MTREEMKSAIGDAIWGTIEGYGGAVEGRSKAEEKCIDIAEDYAKTEAIAFLIWNAGKIFEYVDWFKTKRQTAEPDEDYAKTCEITAFELSTIEKRYELYEQSKNKAQ